MLRVFRASRGAACTVAAGENEIGRGGQFMEIGEPAGAGRRAVEQQAAVVFAPGAHHLPLLGLPGREARVMLRVAAAGGGAEPAHRADGAERVAPPAYERPEFHHRLVVAAGIGALEQGLGERREMPGRRAPSRNAVPSAVSRARTRTTLPSTQAAGAPKARLVIAAAV